MTVLMAPRMVIVRVYWPAVGPLGWELVFLLEWHESAREGCRGLVDSLILACTTAKGRRQTTAQAPQHHKTEEENNSQSRQSRANHNLRKVAHVNHSADQRMPEPLLALLRQHGAVHAHGFSAALLHAARVRGAGQRAVDTHGPPEDDEVLIVGPSER